MTETDELLALRAFRADLDEPPPGALDRIQARAFEPAPAVRLSTGRRLTLAAVAASVVAVAVVVSLVAGRGTPPKPPANPTPSPTVSAIIEHLAQIAAAEPPGLALSPNDVIEFTNTVYDPTAKPQVKTTHLLMSVVGPHLINPTIPGDSEIHTLADLAAFEAQYLADMASAGRPPNPSDMTPEWIAGLNPDPVALRRAILAAAGGIKGGMCVSCQSPAELNQLLFELVDVMVRDGGDAMLTPPLRAGLLRILGEIPGVVADQELAIGRPVVALSLNAATGFGIRQIYVDPTTGHMIGDGGRLTGHRADPSSCTVQMLRGLGTSQPTAGPCVWVTYPPSQQPYGGQQLFFGSLVTLAQGLSFPVTEDLPLPGKTS
jgi:hypothetical protein